MLSNDERTHLLRLAREAIRAHLSGELSLLQPEADSPARASGVFVTLKSGGTLRGCIGSLDETRPIAELVVRSAIASSTQDPRFPPLDRVELDAVRLEISILTVPEPVADPDDIEVGRHGLIVEHGYSRGLLLPQVPLEWGWDREMFLRQTCLKAGLAPDAWRTGARLLRFEAEVFNEEI